MADDPMTVEQERKLGHLVGQWNPCLVSIEWNPFDLPDGYALVTLTPQRQEGSDQFVVGIAPNGDSSS